MTTKRRSIDPARLQRAIGLNVEKLGGRKFLVTGGSMPHVVNLALEYCDCTDFSVRQCECKHLLICRLHEADAEVIVGLREVVK